MPLNCAEAILAIPAIKQSRMASIAIFLQCDVIAGVIRLDQADSRRFAGQFKLMAQALLLSYEKATHDAAEEQSEAFEH